MADSPVSPQLMMSDADIPTLISAWSATSGDFVTLVSSLDDHQWGEPTACPGWNVGDVVAHVMGLERDMAGDPPPESEPQWDSLPHVDRPFSRYTELRVDEARGQSRAAVTATLIDVIERRTVQLNAGPSNENAEVPGLGGAPTPLGRFLRLRVFDTWAHEQDIRAAINLPGDRGTIGASITADNLLSAFPYVVGKKAGAAPGESVAVDVNGEVSFRRTVAVGDDGRAGFVSTPPGDPGSANGATVRITLDWITYFMLGCGRCEPTAVSDVVAVDGDRALGERVLAALSIAP